MKFRRKSDAQRSTEATETSAADEAPAEERPSGPWDAEDLPDEDAAERVDLGSLLVPALPERELRLQVNETSGQVQAVLLAGPDGAAEVRAFAAPRHGDLWSEVRPQIAADMAQRGGTATEREGRFGTELVCQMPVQTEDGRTGVQPSRIVGINGSRWLLRITLMGSPATAEELPEEWAETLTALAVRRGHQPMPVGEALPLVLPENARRVPPPSS